jgi:uncharacterized repeat protein (TIGR01451 family)
MHLYRAVMCLLVATLLIGRGEASAQSCVGPPAGPISLPNAAVGRVPGGLTSDEWNTMRAAIERDQYRLERRGQTYSARNHAQQLEVTFSKEGFEVGPRKVEDQWRWGLHLSGYGYGDHLQAVSGAELVVSDNRIEYRRGALVEWYVNEHRGLEQGFTVCQRPPRHDGEAALQLHLTTTGDLRPQATGDGNGIEWSDEDGRTVLTYSGLYAYDATGRELEASMEVGGRGIAMKVIDEDALYPITIDPFVERIKLTASDGAQNDEFGISVSVSGDTAIVGARRDDDNGSESGSAYVFERNHGGADNWGEVKKLVASDGAMTDEFGFSVAISGDTAIVGARLHTVPNAPGGSSLFGQEGSAYVFERNRGGLNNWGEVKRLIGSDTDYGDEFGFSVAISGDAAIVGARLNKQEDFGSAYIFERHHGGADNWGEVKRLEASDKGTAEEFGFSVAISGDAVVVGARLDERFVSAGSAYIFERNDGGANNWGETRKLTASDGQAGDQFGYDVALGGDTAIIGAPFDDDNGNQSGSAYIFERNQGGANNWGEARKLAAGDATFDHIFGVSVAISGDRVVVGANGETSATGAAYVFERNQGGTDNWGETNKLVASDREQGEQFGVSVAVSGDTAIVGAVFDDDNGLHSGSAYVFGVEGVEADLSLTMSDSPDPVTVGASLTYTITVTNHGPAQATDVRVVGGLPAGIAAADSIVPSQGTCSADLSSPQCELGALADGASASVTIVVTPTAVAQPLANTAYTSWNGSDPDSGNDTATATTMVVVPDEPPVAAPDSYAVDEDSTLAIAAPGVLANDQDPNGDPLAAVLVGAPSNGTLALNADGSFTYTPNLNFHGSDSFSYQARDLSEAESGTTTVTLTVNAVNDAPVNDVPGPQATAAYLPLLFSAGGGNPVSVDDADAGTNAVRVTLSATNGTITLSRTTGLTFAAGNGISDAGMTFTGTIANVNAALNGMRFRAQFGFSGAASLTIATTDQGQSGAGGALVDTDAVPIIVGSGASADIAVTMTDAPDPVLLGNNVTYSIGVTNNGPVQATSVTLVDVLPAGVSFVSAAASQGTCTFMSIFRTVRCDLGALANQAGATVAIVVRPMVRVTLRNQVVAGANQSDPVALNNIATAQTVVQ